MKMRLYVWLCAVAAWFLLAAFDWCGQRQLFFREGKELLSDYWMPRTCVEVGYRVAEGETFPTFAGVMQSGWIEGEMHVARHDRCYPATAIVPMKLFPRTWCGARLWTIGVALVFVGALCWIARSGWPILLLGSMPVLFNLERGNPIGVAAACVGVFLAGYRSLRKGVRIVAALALSLATCLKISPVVLGVLYLREKDWRGIGWCVVLSSILFAVPWFFVPEGFSALPVMVENAKGNFMEYARAAEFGLVDLWRAVRVALHQDCMHLWPGCLAVARLSQVLGLAAIAYGAWKRRPLLAVVGMLWAAGNMHYYGALYFLPLFVMEMRAVKLKMPLGRLALWFVVLCPLQLVVLGHGVNAILCNLASVALALTENWREVSDTPRQFSQPASSGVTCLMD